MRTEIVMFFVRGSKLTFLCAGRKVLVFSVSMEIDLVLVMVVEIDLISVCGIELELVLSIVLQLICCLYECWPKITCFRMSRKIDFVFG